MNRIIRTAAVLAFALAAATNVAAQQPTNAGENPLRPIRLAKWGTLAAAAGTAIYGFVKNMRADNLFQELEQRCEADPVRCEMRAANGAYMDAELEDLYGHVRSLDRTAHTALLLGQIGLGASVALFLLDLGNVKRPPDIPFVPTAVNLDPRADGSLALSVTLPLPRSTAR